ncbi:ribosome silencing factor [Risungbinella massiliensis]|uniref:ribosome silencing factor n=1 Tax=Risungbinella massiliensis TaxID=1329796 RepID=UPI0005CC6CAE|nr:ribosome silencing factor [Risungbinella massiliensis]
MKHLDIAQLAVAAAEDKKAQNITLLNLQGLAVFADYFVICHGNSQTQVQAIAEGIQEKCKEQNITVRGIEGVREGRWVLMDLGDVVVHIFHRDERDFYDLERLWGDAEQIQVN